MKGKPPTRRGLLAGGNWIVDQVKLIDVFPQREQLANIKGKAQAGTGGSPYNVLVGLARAGAEYPLAGAGLIGKDAFGQLIVTECQASKIDTRLLRATAEADTSYTDVMTEQTGGKRTFFHYRGANALWKGDDLDFGKLRHKLFHLGYLLLLDAMDQPDTKFGTKAARLLALAQEAGMKTSVDVVSEDSDRFKAIVSPALKYCDYAILNEIEAGKTAGFRIRQPDGKLDTVSLRHAAGALLQCGVRELVVIHFPEGAFARTRKGEDHWQSSVKLPDKLIAGTAGAGDAFCAGVLHGLHEDWDLPRCLQAGVCLAASSLLHPTCTGGITKLETALDLGKKYKYRPALNPED